MLRKLISLLSLLGLLNAVQAAEGGASPATVNIAGEERMLSQRIAKAYAQIGLNVSPTLAASQKAEATARFEANLEALKPATAASPQAGRAYDKLARVWAAYRRAAAAPISRESALALSRQSLAVQDAADRLVQALAPSTGSSPGRLVNLAGRQRALSQQLAKAYLLRSWGVAAKPLRDELAAASQLFASRLNLLQAASENTPEIRREVDEMALQWEWFQAALAAEGATSYRLIVTEAADSILESADRVTRMYEQLGSR